MLISSSRRLTQVTVAKLQLKLGQHLSIPLRNRNIAYKRSWLSTKKTNATKKDESMSVANTKNEKNLTSPTSSSPVINIGKDDGVKKHLPLNLQKLISPNNSMMTKPVFLDSSIAVMLGHTAFLLTGMAYLTKDILHLRLLAMSGISASMIFQYYRPQPLRMPLRWNSLFLVINCVMASLLYRDRQEAEDMSKEMLEIYHSGLFEKRGFRKVDFYRLFGLAKKEVRNRGDYLKRAGEKTYQLCYIVDGAGIITRDRSSLGNVSDHDFAGEIEFMRFMTADKDIKSEGKSNDAESNVIDLTDPTKQLQGEAYNSSSVANESIIVESDMITLYTWEFDELKSYLDTHLFVSNALLAFISHELREKLAESWNMRVEDDKRA